MYIKKIHIKETIYKFEKNVVFLIFKTHLISYLKHSYWQTAWVRGRALIFRKILSRFCILRTTGLLTIFFPFYKRIASKNSKNPNSRKKSKI